MTNNSINNIAQLIDTIRLAGGQNYEIYGKRINQFEFKITIYYIEGKQKNRLVSFDCNEKKSFAQNKKIALKAIKLRRDVLLSMLGKKPNCQLICPLITLRKRLQESK